MAKREFMLVEFVRAMELVWKASGSKEDYLNLVNECWHSTNKMFEEVRAGVQWREGEVITESGSHMQALQQVDHLQSESNTYSGAA
jgi:hypothetical protein